MSGYFVRKYILDLTSGNLRSISSNPKRKWRFLGAVLTCIGLGVWLYGGFSPFSERIFIWALIFSLLCMILGVPYLVTGRKMSELD